MQLLPCGTEILGLQGEHWLSVAGSELPSSSGDRYLVGGDQGEEEEIKLVFNFAGRAKIDDKWGNF